MTSQRTESSLNLMRGGIGVVGLLAAIATIATFFGLSAPSQVVVLNPEEEGAPPTQLASSDYIARASGVGFAPSAATSDAERRQAALRAAHTVARRNLVAYAQGSDIEAVTVVVGGTLDRDEIRETVRGRLAEAVTISESYDAAAGQAQVVLGIRRSAAE